MRQITFGEYLQEKRWLINAVDYSGIVIIAVLGGLPFVKASSRLGDWLIVATVVIGLFLIWLAKRLTCPRCKQSLSRVSRAFVGAKLHACPYCGLRADEHVWVD